MNRFRRINKKSLTLFALIVCVVFGIALIAQGVYTINCRYAELGTKSSEEINTELGTKAEEYRQAILDANEEFQKNGASDKYVELRKKVNELNDETTSLTNSRYMKETGYNNPNSVKKIMELAPTLWIGTIIIVFSIFGILLAVKKSK
jgi:CHASE3 domain sensor protein